MIRLIRTLSLVTLASLAPMTAFADDTDDEELEEDETEEEAKARREAEKKRLDEADQVDDLLEDDEDELDKAAEKAVEDGTPSDTDLLEDGIDEDVIGGEGIDNATIYRKYVDRLADLVPDEEMIQWERYLERYPKTLFKDRIDKRLDALEEILYNERIDEGDPGRLDADKREILFSQGLLIENINPRTRLQTGFEWGLPDYINLFVDYEHQIVRQLSAHAGMRRRYFGWSIEAGARWAFVKSSRTKTLVVALADLQMNTDPAFLAIQPQLAFGKQLGRVDLQAQAGVRLDTRSKAAPQIIGGVNVTVKADENVSIFVESSLTMKNLTWRDGHPFYFNIGTFGLKFYPLRGESKGQMEVNLGASAPVAAWYWQFHYGSIMGQMNYYFK